jgi:hypothetical protein
VSSGAGAVWQRARFGTVRPRVQIPGPRPIFEFRIVVCRFTAWDCVSQPCHRFSWNSAAAAAIQGGCGPTIELTHGSCTADISERARPKDREAPGSEFQAKTTVATQTPRISLGSTGQAREAPGAEFQVDGG